MCRNGVQIHTFPASSFSFLYQRSQVKLQVTCLLFLDNDLCQSRAESNFLYECLSAHLFSSNQIHNDINRAGDSYISLCPHVFVVEHYFPILYWQHEEWQAIHSLIWRQHCYFVQLRGIRMSVKLIPHRQTRDLPYFSSLKSGFSVIWNRAGGSYGRQ